MATFASLAPLKQNLVRKSLSGGVMIAPATAAAPTRSTIFGTDYSLASTKPTGFEFAGYLTDDGIRSARSQETEDITGWQSLEPVRSDRTSDSETIQVDFLETKKLTLEVYTGADLSSAAFVNGALSIQKPALPTDRYYRLLAFAVDNIDGEEYIEAKFYPRVKVTTFADEARQKSGASVLGVTFTAYVDATLGYSLDRMIGGRGFAIKAATDMGFTVPAPS